MMESSDLRMTRMPLHNGSGYMPALGFGTLIPDAALTKTPPRDVLDAGFRHFDCAERYRNEREVGEAIQAGLAANSSARDDIFVTTKLWKIAALLEDPLDQFNRIQTRQRLNSVVNTGVPGFIAQGR